MDRRTYLATLGSTGLGAVAGCLSTGKTESTSADFDPQTGPTGNESDATNSPDVPSLADVPALSGELTVYLGRGEGGLYKRLLTYLEEKRYEDFSLSIRRNSSASLANTIIEEEKSGSSPADVFWSIDAGSLGIIAKRGLADPLPRDLLKVLPSQFYDSKRRWVGVSGRARSIPYNTETYSESDIPSDVMAFPDRPAFDSQMGWAPRYGAFQAFVTAMRLTTSEDRTRSWLRGMLDSGVRSYSGEFQLTNAIAEGELGAGFANHYYTLRLKEAKPDAPLSLAFTSNDAGALVNASGVLRLASSEKPVLAENFIRHLLTREVQSFLAREAYEYPLVPGIDPPGSLPPIGELNPPDVDLTKLADVKETLRMLRRVGVL
ncbi:MAG: ABC transporter substrate-binding protein [Halodesulfurarchaeum sp.]